MSQATEPWFAGLRAWLVNRLTDGLLDAELNAMEKDRAMFRALADGRSIDPASARAVQGVALAEYVDKYLSPLHRGHTLTKPESLTIDHACEMARDVVILRDADSQSSP